MISENQQKELENFVHSNTYKVIKELYEQEKQQMFSIMETLDLWDEKVLKTFRETQMKLNWIKTFFNKIESFSRKLQNEESLKDFMYESE